MPTIQAFILEGHSDGSKQALIAAATSAVVEAVGAPIDSVRVILSELPPAHFGLAGVAATRYDPVPALFQAFLIAGRTDEQKVRLIAALTASAAVIGVRPDAVRVIIQDIPNTDFGLAGKTAASLGRGVGRAAMRAGT
jgi:4-oxalocrotonate tautomerase